MPFLFPRLAQNRLGKTTNKTQNVCYNPIMRPLIALMFLFSLPTINAQVNTAVMSKTDSEVEPLHATAEKLAKQQAGVIAVIKDKQKQLSNPQGKSNAALYKDLDTLLAEVQRLISQYDILISGYKLSERVWSERGQTALMDQQDLQDRATNAQNKLRLVYQENDSLRERVKLLFTANTTLKESKDKLAKVALNYNAPRDEVSAASNLLNLQTNITVEDKVKYEATVNQLNQANDTITTLRASQELAAKSLDAVKEELTKLQSSRQEIEKLMANRQKEYQGNLAQLTKQLDDQKTSVALVEQVEKQKDLLREVVTLKDRNADLIKAKTQADRNLEEALGKIVSLNAATLQLDVKVKGIQEQLLKVQSTRVVLEQNMEAKLMEAQMLNAQLSRQIKEASKADSSKVAVIVSDNTELKQQVEKLNKQIADKDAVIASVTKLKDLYLQYASLAEAKLKVQGKETK